MRSIVKKAALACLAAAGLSANTTLAAVTLFATDATSTLNINNLNSLSLTNGSATLVGSLGVPPIMAGLAYDAVHGIMYGTTTLTNNLYSIDTATGAATLIGPLGVELMHGLAFDNSTGSLFGAHMDESEVSKLSRIDTSTGAASFVGDIGHFDRQRIIGLAFQPGANILYGCLSGPTQEGGLYTIDPATGAGTLAAPMRLISGLAFHPTTGVLYGIDNMGPDMLYTIDVTSGATTLIGPTGLENNLGLEFAGYIVPEPSGLGLAWIAALLSAAPSQWRGQRSLAFRP